jgi:hypothetical protein
VDEPPPLFANPLSQEINMKARVIALVALALALAVGLPETVPTGPSSAPAGTVGDGSTSLAVALTSAVPSPAGPGGCCV